MIGELFKEILKETNQIAKGIRMYEPKYIYIHRDIIYYMETLAPGVMI